MDGSIPPVTDAPTTPAAEDAERALAARARELLPALYFDPVQYDLLAQMTAPRDLPMYEALAARHGGPILELGAGTGRITIALARAGHEVVGLELSGPMLAAAHAKASAEGLDVTLALGDLRAFDLGRRFALVLVPFNTLNHLLDDDSLARALDAIARHLADDGRLVVDTFQPSPAFLGDAPERRRPILRYRDPYLDREVVLSEEHHYDPATQLDRIVWSYAVGGVEDARVEELTMRLFFPRELDAWLAHAGYALEAKHGDYDGRPFDARSPKQIVIARRAR